MKHVFDFYFYYALFIISVCFFLLCICNLLVRFRVSLKFID